VLAWLSKHTLVNLLTVRGFIIAPCIFAIALKMQEMRKLQELRPPKN